MKVHLGPQTEYAPCWWFLRYVLRLPPESIHAFYAWVEKFWRFRDRKVVVRIEPEDGWYGLADIAEIMVPWLEHVKANKQGVPARFVPDSPQSRDWTEENEAALKEGERLFNAQIDLVLDAFEAIRNREEEDVPDSDFMSPAYDWKLYNDRAEAIYNARDARIKTGLKALSEIWDCLYV